jgi:hypothetical protein
VRCLAIPPNDHKDKVPDKVPGSKFWNRQDGRHCLAEVLPLMVFGEDVGPDLKNECRMLS